MKISNADLISETKLYVAKEREMMLEVLARLREIEFRMLFAERGYSSLHEFCVREFGYSDGAAYRRIQSMRLLKDLPEVRSKIEAGSVSLTTLSTLQGFFQKDKTYSKPDKLALIKECEGKSKLEVERRLTEIRPEYPKPDQIRAISEHRTEITVTIDQETFAMLEKIKNLTARHKLDEVLKLMAKATLEKLEKTPKTERASTKPSASPRHAASLEKLSSSRYIPVPIKRKLRSENQCTYVDPQTKRRCESKHALQIDHIRPLALGGTTDSTNLRLLCRTHNRYAAVQVLGRGTMRKYLSGIT